MKILITGGAGHIGSYLIRELPNLLKIKEIYIVDNMISNRYCSLFDLPDLTRYKFLDIDLSKNELNSLPEVDIVIHLAAKTDAAQSANREEEFYSNNLEATKSIIEYSKSNDSKLIFASTTSVYGPQSDLVDEQCDKTDLNPQSPYADVKLIEEDTIRNELSSKDGKYLILRFGTVYGYAAGIRFHTAVNKFCFQAANGIPLTVWKTAYHQVRPYLGLGDLNRSLSHIIENQLFDNSNYNIVSQNCTVKEIVDSIRIYLPNLEVEYVEHEIMNQLSYEVSNKKFSDTNFLFNSDLDINIRETIHHLKNLV